MEEEECWLLLLFWRFCSFDNRAGSSKKPGFETCWRTPLRTWYFFFFLVASTCPTGGRVILKPSKSALNSTNGKLKKAKD
jgi:hypothetical protein